jgi:hypothetical protein
LARVGHFKTRVKRESRNVFQIIVGSICAILIQNCKKWRIKFVVKWVFLHMSYCPTRQVKKTHSFYYSYYNVLCIMVNYLYRVIHLLPPVAKWPLRIEKNLWNLQIWFVEKFTFGRYNLFQKKFFFYEQIFIKSCLKKKNMFKFLHQNVANGV